MPKAKLKKACIWLRVSTQRQKEEGTIQMQKQIVGRLAKERGFEVVHRTVLDGISGEDILKTPQWREHLRQIEEGAFKYVLCYNTNRIFRADEDEMVQAIIRGAYSKHGIQIITPSQTVKFDTPQDRLWGRMWGVIDAYQKGQLADMMKDGRVRKRQAGILSGGTPPYGYYWDKEEKKIKRDEERIQVYLKMVELSIKGLSNWKIVEYLKEHNCPTGRKGSKWHTPVVSKILNNPCYADGFFYINREKFNKETGKYEEKPKEEWIKCTLPGGSVIPKDVFQRLQKSIESRRLTGARPPKEYLLSGFLRCGVCGAPLVATKNQQKRYYWCYNRAAKSKGRKGCKLPCIDADMVEGVIWNRLKWYLTEPKEALEELTGRIQRKRLEERLAKEVVKIKGQMEKITNQEKRLLRKMVQELISDAAFQEEAVELKKRREKLESELSSKFRELENVQLDDDILKEVEEGANKLEKFKEVFKAKLDGLPFEDKRKLILAYFPKELDGHFVVMLMGVAVKPSPSKIPNQSRGSLKFVRLTKGGVKPSPRSKERVWYISRGGFDFDRVLATLVEIGLISDREAIYNKYNASL